PTPASLAAAGVPSPSSARAAPVSPGSGVLARRPVSTPDTVATALALALLAEGEWAGERMIARAATVFGVRHRWLPRLVRELLAVYRQAPEGSPRELAAVIRRTASFTAALEHATEVGRPLTIVSYPVAADGPPRLSPALSPPSAAVDGIPLVAASNPRDPRHGTAPAALATAAGPAALATATGPAALTPAAPPRGLAGLRTLADLAELLGVTPGELDWLADVGAWNRRASPGPLHHYRYEWRARPGRVPRLLEVPSARMRSAQRTLLHDVFALLPLNDAAHGFVPGRSAVTAARLHTGAAVVVTLDLTTFFATVTAGRIFGALRQAGAGERVALALTGIATNRVPPRVITAMPPGGDPDERAALRRALAAAHLPQGGPSSPALANLALRRLDSRLAGYAGAAGARYTRYADDLTFSGGTDLRRRADAFVVAVRRIVEEENHTVNLRKTRVRPAATSQRVTGIVVNEHTALPRAEFDRLKAILHNCAERGPASENRAGHDDFRAHLLGRLTWARSLNPAKAERLQREFDRIAW
ncbi:hypothetical protein C5B96_02615, partial [Subtercola sp. Z020]|uniref:reverse transcriptase family protein n=1 Tax=Subtercola sp. Z020 TaxID=2080582 RepID=UPI000CE8B377